ncbi:unnamed protein product [Blepharisma stoltei]|uniref:DJ-1/PfpI domain-containing protein n=1 Tax=Blepharisma stoltei TaxID=1481888 RepID=A0AAU9JX71_9CILI|nr:unnamed protein product [Blepharisma stoltei]
MPAKRVLILTGDCAEDLEVMVPYQVLKMVGHHVDAVCPDKLAGQSVRTIINEMEGAQTYSEKRGHNFELNATFADIQESSYDALVIPGGRAPEYIRLNPRVIEIVRHFATNNKPIAITCHGIQILTAANVLSGRNVTAYYACGPEVTNAGGHYVMKGITEVLVDGNLVTAVAWPGNSDWLAEFLKLLGTTITP